MSVVCYLCSNYPNCVREECGKDLFSSVHDCPDFFKFDKKELKYAKSK